MYQKYYTVNEKKFVLTITFNGSTEINGKTCKKYLAELHGLNNNYKDSEEILDNPTGTGNPQDCINRMVHKMNTWATKGNEQKAKQPGFSQNL